MQKIPVLSANCLHKSFARNAVLKGVNLELFPGKLYGIVGENGCGKTTLINILSGYWKADKGKVKCASRIGYCPQKPYLFANLSVNENISLFCYAYGLCTSKTGSNNKGYIKQLLETFGLGGYEGQICSKLSEGTKQKLNLIISLIHDPEILLMDEPYTALDWQAYIKFWDYSLLLRKQGKTILMASHLIYDKSRMDRIWELKNGQLI